LRNSAPSGGCVSHPVPPAWEVRAGGAKRRFLIERLRARVEALEQHPVSLAIPPAPDMARPSPACSILPLKGGGLHELKPASHADAPAALAFTLSLLGLYLRETAKRPLALWCLTRQAAREWGLPYGPGLLSFGLDPARLLIVEARKSLDAAWALEEGLQSGCLAASFGQTDGLTQLAARRLGLAAKQGRIPCLLLTRHKQAALPGTLTRWRIAASPSAQAGFDTQAPGAPRWQLISERGREMPPGTSFTVEFSHAAYAVRLVPAFSDRAAETGAMRIRAMAG
jgi:protein ImuA